MADPKRDRRAFSTTFAIVLALMLFYLCTYNTFMLISDLYTDVATGSWILQNGSLPHTEFVSWWAQANHAPLVAHQWLYQVLASVVVGPQVQQGYHWMVLIFSFVALAFLLGLYRLVDPDDDRSPAAMLVFVAAAFPLIYLFPVNMLVRPQTLVLLIMVAMTLLASKPLTGRGRVGVFLMAVLAANLHGGFWPVLLLFFVVIARKRRDPWVLANSVAVLLTPAGIGILDLPLLFASGTELSQRYVMEWQPLWAIPFQSGIQVAWATAVLVFGGLLLLRRRKHPEDLPWVDLLGFAALAALPMVLSIRYFVIFLVLAIPYFSRPIVAELGEILDRALPTTQKLLYVLVLVPLVGMAAYTVGFAAENRVFTAPQGSVPISEEVLAEARGRRVFNADYNYGGILYSKGVSGSMNGRFDVFLAVDSPAGGTMLHEYMGTLDSKDLFLAFLDRNQVEQVLVPKGGGFDLYARYGLESDPLFPVLAEDDGWRLLGVVRAP